MVKHRRLAGALVALLALTLVAAACGSDDDGGGSGDTGGTDAVSGSITISGSSTVEPISSVVAEVFNETTPTCRSASTAPVPATASSSSARARPTSPTPPVRSRTRRRRPARRTASSTRNSRSRFDGVTVMTNPENADVTCLNVGDLYALFGPESDGIDTWNGADSLAAAGRRQRRVPRRPAGDHGPRSRSRGPTTPSSSSRGSKTSRSSRACPRTRPPRCAATTSRRRTTT